MRTKHVLGALVQSVALPLLLTSVLTVQVASAQTTTTDTEVMPTLSIDSPPSVSEGGGPVVFTVTLSDVSSQTVTVDYATADGSASAGLDYIAIPATTLTFPPGTTSQPINVTILDDWFYENGGVDETFEVNLSNPSNAVLGAPSQGTGSIQENEPVPELSIDSPPSVNEGEGPVVFTVTLSVPSSETVSVDYATADQEASAGLDYIAIPATTLTFPPGTTNQLVNVTILDDLIYENDGVDETFQVILSSPSNAVVGVPSQGTGSIHENEPTPTLSIDSPPAVDESIVGATAAFTVTLSVPSSETVTVNYATADGSASAGLDYIAIPFGDLMFPPGTTSQPVNVTILDDLIYENDGIDETFTVNLAYPSGSITISVGSGTGSIRENELAPVLDADGDGFSATEDCDDTDPAINPDATEVCDAVDNNCDGGIDEGLDADDDGIADCFDDCPFDTDNDIDDDAVCGDVDNCSEIANEDQTDFNDDGVGDACTPCEPDPRSQGYWHRQCLGVPAAEGGIDPGRNGRGPQEPLEGQFDKSMDAVSVLLGDFFEFGGACAGGMDADPASDPCEKALKHSTALLFSLATSRLSGSCTMNPPIEGCNSTNLTDLVNELEGLINSGTDANCQQAAACAAAVNGGAVLLESAVVPEPAVEVVESTEGPEATPASSTQAPARERRDSAAVPQEEVVAEISATVEAPAPLAQPLMLALPGTEIWGLERELAEGLEPEAAAGSEDELQAMQRHLAVLSNPSAPERALRVSTDVLLTMLSGGYEPGLRLEIIERLLSRIDAAYHGLLAGHLEAIRSEAEDFGEEDLAEAAAKLLTGLDASVE